MVTTSEFDGGRRTVSFDRVELGGPNFPEHPFELSQTIDLTGDGLPTVTWIYDSVDDTVTWSSPSRSSSGSRSDPRILGGPGRTRSSPRSRGRRRLLRSGRHRRRPPRPDPHPIRAGVPPAEFDLHYTVTCPTGPPGSRSCAPHPSRPAGPDDLHALQRRGHRRHGPAAVRVRAERPRRPLPPPHRGHPDVVIVHQDGLLVYGNRAAVSSSTWTPCGPLRRAGHRLGPPDDINGMIERLGRLTEPGQFFEHGEVRAIGPTDMTYMELTSIRTTWEASRPTRPSSVTCRSARRRGRRPLPGEPGGPRVGRHHRYRRRRPHRELERAPRSSTAGPRRRCPALHRLVVSANRTDSASLVERGQRSHRRKDGSTVDVLVSIDPLVDDDTLPSGWVVVITELTDARQAEAGRRAPRSATRPWSPR